MQEIDDALQFLAQQRNEAMDEIVRLRVELASVKRELAARNIPSAKLKEQDAS